MKILFVASECVPFCKTGGLADVVGALAKELRAKRHDVRIVLPKYKSVRASVFNIHNIAYQGLFPKSILEATGFSWNEFRMDTFEYYDKISFLKAGLVYAEMLNTVSPTYAQEIQSTYEFGHGMEGILRDRS